MREGEGGRGGGGRGEGGREKGRGREGGREKERGKVGGEREREREKWSLSIDNKIHTVQPCTGRDSQVREGFPPNVYNHHG